MSFRSARAWPLLAGLLCSAAAGGCDPVPRISWEEIRSMPATPGSEGVDLFGDPVPATAPAAGTPASLAAGCSAAAAVARAAQDAFAAWWAVRPDSSAVLLASRSQDGGISWSPAFVVDSLDRGRLGCRRPPPALAVQRGQMYVAYAMDSAEGTGVFFAHWMAGMVHAPVTVIYGDRVVPVALAVHDSTVAVAYQDPSSRTPQVGVAVSRTEGHAFEYHSRASGREGAATDPAVAVRRDRVAVSWAVPQGGRLLRVGRLN